MGKIYPLADSSMKAAVDICKGGVLDSAVGVGVFGLVEVVSCRVA